MDPLSDDHIRLVSLLEDSLTHSLEASRKPVYRLPSLRAAEATSEKQDVLDSSDKRQLTSKETYVALSYAWGTDIETVLCDGTEVEVSSNLVMALKRLNRHFPNSLFWTDSLSINQGDLREKSHQVGMMGRIFSEASTVAVWLGLGADQFYKDLHDLDQSTQSGPNASKRRINLLRLLSQIAWFYRVWTFQEIRLARNAVVVFDKEIMSWTKFIGHLQAIRALEPQLSTVEIRSQPQTYSRFHYYPQDRFFAILNELNAGTSQDLAGLLFVTWYRDATEKRDKVYSLLSSELLSDTEHGLAIDYKVAWSELCIKTARVCINTSRNLKILKIAGMTQRWRSPLTNRWDPHELQHLLSHPSWAPDWWHPPQQTRSHTSLVFNNRGIFQSFDFCCSPQPPLQDVNDSSPFLVLRGIFLGLINVAEHPTFPGGPILVHPTPNCARTTQRIITDPTRDGRGISQVLMPYFIPEVERHLNGDCFCVPFHQHQTTSFTNPTGAVSSFNTHSQTPKLHFSSNESFAITSTPRPTDKAESEHPAEVLAQSVESGDWLVLLEGSGEPLVLRPVKDTHARVPNIHEFQTISPHRPLPLDSGLFVLVGEASMCWDNLWRSDWETTHCRAGTFVIV